MHSCPLCGQACDCDGEDTWLEEVVDIEGCNHQCEEPDDEVDDDWPDQYDQVDDDLTNYYEPGEDDDDDEGEEGLAFGYNPEWGWYPPVGEVEFKATLTDVMQPDGKVQKHWVIAHNLNYYPLIFLWEGGLGMAAEAITGEMVVKACLAASWDNANLFFASTFARLVESGSQAEDDDEEEEGE